MNNSDMGSATAFLSYASADRHGARTVLPGLLARHKEVWVDWRAIGTSRTDWRDRVRDAIAMSSIFYALRSDRYDVSQSCQFELGLAISYDLPVRYLALPSSIVDEQRSVPV